MGSSPPILRSARLRLVGCSEETVLVDDRADGPLGRLIGAQIPETWPPELYDAGARQYNLRFLREHPDATEWSMWYLVLVGTAGEPDVAVGLAGFKGPPDEHGVVEVGYGVLEAFRRRGIATEATARLIEFAMADRAVTRVAAETYPELVGSIGVMMRNRMRYVGPGSEPGVIRYEVSREVWAGT